MQRIQTPTAVAEMFVDGPPNATHYSAIWSNNIQESLARPIEQQGILLDGADFDQWTLMLQSYRYLAGGMPTVEGGAQFRVLTGGFFTIATGGTFQVDSGATVTLSDGSTVSLLGDLTIGTDDTNTLAIESSITTVILANLGITGAFGGNPVDLPEGANIPAGKLVTYTGSTLTSSPAGLLTWNGTATFNAKAVMAGQLTLTAVTGVIEGDISVSGDNVRYRDSVGNKFFHKTISGWFKGRGQTDTDGGATVQIDTQAVAPLAAADVDIVASAWIQRNGAGDVIVSILEVGGAGQIGVSQTISVPDDAANDFKTVTFSRTRVAADTTPRVYRFFIDGDGADVSCKALHITATPAT